jgi:hypothetical protein
MPYVVENIKRTCYGLKEVAIAAAEEFVAWRLANESALGGAMQFIRNGPP